MKRTGALNNDLQRYLQHSEAMYWLHAIISREISNMRFATLTQYCGQWFVLIIEVQNCLIKCSAGLRSHSNKRIASELSFFTPYGSGSGTASFSLSLVSRNKVGKFCSCSLSNSWRQPQSCKSDPAFRPGTGLRWTKCRVNSGLI